MRELLLGYLLDALDSQERARVERLLAADPALRAELAELKASLKPLDDDPEHLDPPPELAARTCESLWRLTEAATPAESQPVVPAGSCGFTASESPASGGWRFHDMAVAAGICLTAALLVFPAIDQSRTSAQITGCANNLRQLGMAFANYSQFEGGFLPHVPSQGNLAGAGVYAPTLVSTGRLENSRTVVCPGSRLAADTDFRVPTVGELQRAGHDEIVRLRSRMGGSYGYTLGYFKNGRYQDIRDQRRDNFALSADAPSLHLPGLQSANHAGRGQNVLFESGRVTFWKTPRPADAADGLFTNEEGYIEAGTCDSDAVVGGSTSVPIRGHDDGF
jgi:hypothetical protein